MVKGLVGLATDGLITRFRVCGGGSLCDTGGMGTLDQGTGSTVHGVCHLLAPSDYATLCRMEEGYSEVEVVVEAYDGRAITATIFCSLPDRRTTDGIPPLRYLKLLQEGAREWDLDQGYRV
eukprot:gene652-1084_t